MPKLTPEQQTAVKDLMGYVAKIALQSFPGDEDIRSLAFEWLCEAAIKYVPDRHATFKTFVYMYLRDRLKNHRIKRFRPRKINYETGRDTALAGMIARHDGIQEVEIRDLLRVLSPRDREIFTLRYSENYTLKCISVMYGISEARIRQILKRCKERLRREIDGKPSSNTSRRV